MHRASKPRPSSRTAPRCSPPAPRTCRRRSPPSVKSARRTSRELNSGVPPVSGRIATERDVMSPANEAATQRVTVSREEAYQAAIRAFGDVAGALGEVENLDDLLHMVAKHICDLVHVQRCSVYLRDKDSELFRGQVGHSDRDIDALVKRLTAGVPGDKF